MDDIIRTELTFPEVFTYSQKREWGILFFNENNKISHDSNHAILFPDKIKDLSVVLEEIKVFYQEKKIVPRIYHPFINGFLKENNKLFIKHGYHIEVYDNCQYMFLTDTNKIIESNKLNLKLLKSWDERIKTDILIPNKSEYEIDVIKNSLAHDNYYMFVGYIDNQAVTIASLLYSEYKCARLDIVQTAVDYRNKGYSKELISFVVEFHKKHSKSLFYLWADNPIAQRIYMKAGFTLIPNQYESWSAIYSKK